MKSGMKKPPIVLAHNQGLDVRRLHLSTSIVPQI